jgi:shikimate dehydrogenase
MATRRNDRQRRAAVIGWPVSHSLSPLIHMTWAMREGVDATYEAIAAEPTFEAFQRVADRLQAAGYRGANVTLPHKEHALRYAASASDEAKAAGAANMLTFRGGGAHAENSDIAGFAEALGDPPTRRGPALIIGAGGAARGVALALARRCGVPDIIVVNRTRARAYEVAALVGGVAIGWEQRRDAARGAAIIVNASSLGMTGQPPLDLDAAAFLADAVVCDIVYAPLETPLLRSAKATGLRTVDGLEMLVRQAVPGYLAWFGTRAEADANLRARLEAALRARAA